MSNYRVQNYLFLFFYCFLSCLYFSGAYADDRNGYKKYYEYAKKLEKEHRYQEAEKLLTIAIKKNPHFVGGYYERAIVRQTLKKHQLAIKDYSLVIKLDHRLYPKAFWRRGLCLYNLAQYPMAIKDYSRCLKLIPTYEKVYFMRAKAYGKLGMINEALKDLKSAVKYGPNYKQSAQALANKILLGNEF